MCRTPRFNLAAALAAVAFICACSGGGGSKTGTPGSGGAITAASGATVSPELKALTDKFSANSFKADYTLTSSGGSSPLDGTMTLYKDGPNKFRFDVKSKQDGQDVSIVLIETSSVSAFCLDNAGDLGTLLGVDSGQGVCFKNDPANGAGGIKDLASTFKELSGSNTEVLDKSARRIIGQDAECYHYRNTQTSDTSDTCFSSEGVPLYDKTDSGSDTTTVEATAMSGSINGTDFDLPYAVRDFPSIGDSTSTP